MTEIDRVKAAANPFAQLMTVAVENGKKQDVTNKLLGEDLKVNKDILKEKKNNHSVWLRVSKHRRYINIAAVLVTVAILWLDVLKLNPDSEIVGSVIGVTKVVAGFFL
jgi:hypothetical protein